MVKYYLIQILWKVFRNTYIHTYMHAHIRAYMHACIHAHIQVCVGIFPSFYLWILKLNRVDSEVELLPLSSYVL